MRCKACNKQLNDNESVYKDNETGEYLDMCNNCIRKSYASFDLDSDDDRKYLNTLFTNY
jgi:hypothetical protein